MLRFLQYEQQRHLGYMAAGLLPDSWSNHKKAELKSHDKVIKILFDLGESEEQNKKLEVRLREAWSSHWGDPSDPETQRKINDTAEALRQRRQVEVKDDRFGRNTV